MFPRLYLAHTSHVECAIVETNAADAAAAAAYRSERRRAQFVAGRKLLRLALAHEYGPAAAATEVVQTKDGAPTVAIAGLRLSISHSGEWFGCVLCADRACGVDVQRAVDKPLLEIAEEFFTAEEHVRLAALDPDARRELFYRCWTLKEAWAKASGTDLLPALGRVRIAQAGEHASPEWLAWSFVPSAGIAGALAVRAQDEPMMPSIAVFDGETFAAADLAAEALPIVVRAAGGRD